MVKTPYIVAGAVIVAAIAAAAYLELRPASVVPTPPVAQPPALPAPPVTAQPPADCLLPGPPPVAPDGGKATADDMKLGHDVFQAFVVSLEAYQACRENQISHAGAGVTADQKFAWRDQGNAAVDEAHALASAFSTQLKIYHTKHPEPLSGAPNK